MKKIDFIKKMDKYGINLEKINVKIDELVTEPNMICIYEKDDQWFLYNKDNELMIRNEDDAFDTLYKEVMKVIKEIKYFPEEITEEIMNLSNSTIIKFLMEECKYDKATATKAFEYLKKDTRVFNEFKYYLKTKKFIDEGARQVLGHTAKELYETTSLGVPGVFKFLIYLKEEPMDALNVLKGMYLQSKRFKFGQLIKDFKNN